MIAFIVVFLALLAVGQSNVQLQRRIENDTIILGERSNITWEKNTFDDQDSTALITRGFFSRVKPPASNPMSEPVSVPLEMREGPIWTASILVGHLEKEDTLQIRTFSQCISASISGSSRRVWKPSLLSLRCESSGGLRRDTIKIGGLIWEEARFKEPGKFPSVLGLSPKAPFVRDFIQQKVNPPIFGLYLAETGSQLHIGGPHKDYRGEIEYHKTTSLWRAVASIFVGEKEVVKSVKVLLDSSIPYILGSYQDTSLLRKELYKNRGRTCDHVFIRWKSDGGKNEKWKLINDGQTCENVAESTVKFDIDINFFRIGTDFMKTVYVVYDATEGQERMGIAHRKH